MDHSIQKRAKGKITTNRWVWLNPMGWRPLPERPLSYRSEVKSTRTAGCSPGPAPLHAGLRGVRSSCSGRPQHPMIESPWELSVSTGASPGSQVMWTPQWPRRPASQLQLALQHPSWPWVLEVRHMATAITSLSLSLPPLRDCSVWPGGSCPGFGIPGTQHSRRRPWPEPAPPAERRA